MRRQPSKVARDFIARATAAQRVVLTARGFSDRAIDAAAQSLALDLSAAYFTREAFAGRCGYSRERARQIAEQRVIERVEQIEARARATAEDFSAESS